MNTYLNSVNFRGSFPLIRNTLLRGCIGKIPVRVNLSLSRGSTSVIFHERTRFRGYGSRVYVQSSNERLSYTPVIGYVCSIGQWRLKGDHSLRHFSVDKPTIVYKFPYMRHARVMSRLKIYQTAFTVALVAFLYRGYVHGDVAWQSVLYGTFAMTTASCVLAFYSYFAMKFIGEMQLLESTGKLRVSTMNFFGKRQEMVIPLDTITMIETDPINTPGRMNSLYSKFEYIDKNNAERTLYFCPRWGLFPAKEKFGILSGKRLSM